MSEAQETVGGLFPNVGEMFEQQRAAQAALEARLKADGVPDVLLDLLRADPKTVRREAVEACKAPFKAWQARLAQRSQDAARLPDVQEELNAFLKLHDAYFRFMEQEDADWYLLREDAEHWIAKVTSEFPEEEARLVAADPRALSVEEMDKRYAAICNKLREVSAFLQPEQDRRKDALTALLNRQKTVYVFKQQERRIQESRRKTAEARRAMLETVPRSEALTTYGYPLGYEVRESAVMHPDNPEHPRNVEKREGRRGYSLPDSFGRTIHDPFLFQGWKSVHQRRNGPGSLETYHSKAWTTADECKGRIVAGVARDALPHIPPTNGRGMDFEELKRRAAAVAEYETREAQRDTAREALSAWLLGHAVVTSKSSGNVGGPALLADWCEALAMEAERIEEAETARKRRLFLTDYLPWAFEHAGAAWIDVKRWADGDYADLPVLKKVREHLERVDMDQEGRSTKQPFLTLLGANGVGKSASVVIALLEHQANKWAYCGRDYRAPVVFWNAQEMATGEAFNRRAHALVERAKTAPILVINEFATEVLYDNSPWPTRLASVIDARYSAGRVTILTTNKDEEGIEEHYRGKGLNSIISRINGGRKFEIPGKDLREHPLKLERKQPGALGMVPSASATPRYDDLRGNPDDAPQDVRRGVVRAETQHHDGPGDVDW